MVKQAVKLACRTIAVLLMLLAFIFTLTVTGVFKTMLNHESVVANYRWCVGILIPFPINYDWIVDRYGMPNNLETEKPFEDMDHYLIFVSYEKLDFMFVADGKDELEDTSLWELTNITTSDPKHYFGKSKIHVGSSRQEVIETYRKEQAAPDLPIGERYVDGDIEDFVGFTYDENDIVTSISFGSWM